MPSTFDNGRKTLSPLKDAWMEKLRAAKDSKKVFRKRAQMCDAFFQSDSGFMWEQSFRSKYVSKSMEPPPFQVTIAKAFELVALFGPTMFWRYPNRNVRNYDPIEYTPEAFGDQNNPYVQQFYQQAVEEERVNQSRNRTRNQVVEKYLNYSQREQPGGGLAMHGEMAITEALVKGRGCLWTEAYRFPGSQRMLTGSRFYTVDDLFIDPDCEDPTLVDCDWIALRHWTSTWRLERMFGRKPGTWDGRGSHETHESEAGRRSDENKQNRWQGKTFDNVCWYEIWSRGGVGTRLFRKGDAIDGMNNNIARQLDSWVGDYAYLCVADGISEPLNAPGKKVLNGNQESIAEMFEWRSAGFGPAFPCYIDERWPVALLDFYKVYNSPWPLGPMTMGLGELICLNILASAFIQTAWESRQPIIAFLGSQAAAVENALKKNGLLEIQETLNKSVNEIIQFLQRPGVTPDLIQAISYISELFDKRTGLSEIMYAMNVGGKQSRTAADARGKEERASIRPDKMGKDVAAFMGQAADLEKFLAAWTLSGEDVQPLLGKAGAMVWDTLVAGEDPEVLVREMRATVEATDIRKPNKARENENMQNLTGFVAPILQQYAQITTDPEPLNAFIDTLGDSMEQNTSMWRMKPWAPAPPPPEVQQQMQAEQQAEQAKLQAEVQGKQLDAQVKQQEAQMKMALEQQKMQNEQIKMQLEEQARKQELMFEMLKTKVELEADQKRHEQELQQDQEQHAVDLAQSRMSGAMQIQQTEQMGDAKIAMAKKQAAAKPKPKPSKNGKK